MSIFGTGGIFITTGGSGGGSGSSNLKSLGTWDAANNLTTSINSIYNGLTLQSSPQTIFQNGDFFVVTNADNGVLFTGTTYYTNDQIIIIQNASSALIWFREPFNDQSKIPQTTQFIGTAMQTIFNVGANVAHPTLIELKINNIEYTYGYDFTIDSNPQQIRLTGINYTIQNNDIIEFKYYV